MARKKKAKAKKKVVRKKATKKKRTVNRPPYKQMFEDCAAQLENYKSGYNKLRGENDTLRNELTDISNRLGNEKLVVDGLFKQVDDLKGIHDSLQDKIRKILRKQLIKLAISGAVGIILGVILF